MTEENIGTYSGGTSGGLGPGVERRSPEGDEAAASRQEAAASSQDAMAGPQGADAWSRGEEGGGADGGALEDLGEKARERSERWSGAASRKVVSLMHALEAAEERLRADGEDRMAEWAASVAEGVERMSGYLEREDREALMDDAERVGRDHPVTFLGSSLAAGLAVGRFVRASRRPSGGNDVAGRPREDNDVAPRQQENGESWRGQPWPEGSSVQGDPGAQQDSGAASVAGLPHGQPSGPPVAESPEETTGGEVEP